MSANSLRPLERQRPKRDSARSLVKELLARADVRPQGDRPWDIQVNDERFYNRVLAQGSLGLGEAYVDGWWDCTAPDQLIFRLLQSGAAGSVRPWLERLGELRAKLLNLQNPARAYVVGERHYDIGNDLYQSMLDRRMIYSCAYWRDADTLDAAQEAKLDLICRKLGLEPGMRVLDIGCGWGGAAQFAAERYGVEVVGITVSQAQQQAARERCRGLPVSIRLQDYRQLQGPFDRIFSVGMFEHVGYKNYPTYLRVVRDCLSPDGLFLLHTIGANESANAGNPWVERYIFPNSMLPSARQITVAAEGTFTLEDWHCFGPDYDRTLMHWWQNCDAHRREIEACYGDRFLRMWRYYLLSFAGAFRARHTQLWQLVFSPLGSAIAYRIER